MMSSIAQRAPNQAWRYGFCYFALFAIYGIVSPYLQLLLKGLGYSPSVVGLFLSLFEIVGIAAPLAISHMRAFASRSKLVLFGTALIVIASLPSLALVPKPLVTALSIALLAVGEKTMVPFMDAEAVSFSAASAASGAKRKKNSYGSLRVMGSIGFICTSFAFGLLPGADKSPPWVIGVAIAATSLFFILSVLTLPARGTAGEAGALEGNSRPAQGPEASPRRFDPVFALGLAIIALNRLAMAPVSSFLSLYVSDGLHLSGVGGLWALASAAEMPLMLLAGLVIARIGPMAAIAISTCAVALRLGIYAAFPSIAGVAAGQLLHSLCYGLYQPAAMAFVAQRVPEERRPAGMAIYMGAGVGLPAVVGSALGGFVVEGFGYRALFISFIGFAALSLVLYLATRRKFAD
jgi:PPP family 3-phenylpropionic acid transporter